MANRLFCTFTDKEYLEETIYKISVNYELLFGKIFVLESAETTELICTYNPDQNNINESKIIANTILLHRKKETNTLYSINSLNILLKELNNGILNKSIQINWENYRNCILLTRKGIFTKLNTKIHSIKILN